MAKEKSITELRDEKRQLSTSVKEIIAEARAANDGRGRQFTAKEEEEIGKAQCRMAEINLEIAEHEAENRGKGKLHADAGGRFSLRRAIKNMCDGVGQTDVEAQVIEEARTAHDTSGVQASDRRGIVIPVAMESRTAFTAGAESASGVLIDQDQQEMLLPLQASLVLARAGARFMTGLRGDIYWPKFTGANVMWEAENADAKDGAGTFSKGDVFKPLRLTAYVDISKQLLAQENTSVEAYIRQAIATAISQKIEATALGNGSSVANTPDGIFATLDSNIKGDMTWAQIVAMETAADTQNALFGNLAYIMHPALVGKAKTKVKDASGAGGFIFTGNGDGTLNGYRALRTSNVAKSLGDATDEYGIVFGNWNDYFVGQWGGIELLVDPYTQALKGTLRLIANSYWNVGFIRKESFCVASMK